MALVKIYFRFQSWSRTRKFDVRHNLYLSGCTSGWCAQGVRACLVADDDGCVLVSRALKKQKARARGSEGVALATPAFCHVEISIEFFLDRNVDTLPFPHPLCPFNPSLHLFPPCIPSSTVASLFCSSLSRLYPQTSLFFFFFFFFILLLPTLSETVSGSLTLPYPPGGGEPSLFATRTWFPHIKESYLLMRHNYPPFTMATRCPRGGESENRVRFGRVQSLTDRDTEGNDTQTIS